LLWTARRWRTNSTSILTRRRVTVSFHHPGETFEIKTLRTMIELQARWTDKDLKRLKVIR
jgi:hypothetical protein